MADSTYKTTAVALQGRRLVVVRRRSGGWSAELTADGRHYLEHGTYPTPSQTSRTPPKRRASTAPRAVPVAASAAAEMEQQDPARRDVAAATRKPGPAQRLVDEVQAAGGVLVVQRPTWVAGRPTGVDYEILVMSANRYRKVPPGTRLTTRNLAWPGLEVRLEPDDAPASISSEPVPVTVPDRVAAFHPAVAGFRDRPDRHEVSPRQLHRTCRLLHALAVEADRRGHTVAVAADPPAHRSGRGWSSTVDGHITVTVDDRSFPIRVCEEGLPARGQHNRTNLPGTPYPTHGGTGRLRLTIVGHSGGDGYAGRWNDGVRERVEDKLGAVLVEVERRAAKEHHFVEQLARERSDEEHRRQAATEQARAAYLEAERTEHFHEQVRRWQLVPQAAAFVDALRAEVAARAAAGDDVAAAQQWLTWTEQYVAGLDPLRGDLRLPDIAEPTPEQLQAFLRGTGRPRTTRRTPQLPA